MAGDPAMWLILTEDHDAAAAWAWAGLQRRAIGRVELVTASALADFSRLTHRIRSERTDIEVHLADGRAFRGADIKGTFNRLAWAGNPRVEGANPADRSYAGLEWHGLCASWIHGLSGRVLNRPTGRGLCGSWPRPSEWAFKAARCGLATRPQALGDDDHDLAPSPTAASPYSQVVPVFVVDGHVLAEGLDESTMAACRRLASGSAIDVLGIRLAADAGGGWELVGATPIPDLRPGGEPLLDLLAHALGIDGDR